jgi:L-iditol 2-dehydrogenase
MRAAVLHGREDVRVENISPPPLEAGEVRIQIEAALTCGTDLKVFKRGYHARMIQPPAVFGHELAGFISEVSPQTGEWRIGDRVVVANSAPCGKCFHCRNAQENLCDDLLFLNGAYAESIRVPARLVEKNLVRLKPETSFADAALTEPLACVVQGMHDTKIKAGEKVLVLGAGPIGLMFVALSRANGAQVSVAGRGRSRLEAAEKLGAHQIFDVSQNLDSPEPPGDKRFDVVIEAVGKPETWEMAARLARKGGRVNLFGGCPSGSKASFDTGLLHYSALTLLASFHHTPAAIREALSHIEKGTISSRDFVDGRAKLSELPDLFRAMAAGNRAIKTLVDVHS